MQGELEQPEEAKKELQEALKQNPQLMKSIDDIIRGQLIDIFWTDVFQEIEAAIQSRSHLLEENDEAEEMRQNIIIVNWLRI